MFQNRLTILGTLLFRKTNIIKKCLIIHIKYIKRSHDTKENSIKIDWLLGLTPTPSSHPNITAAIGINPTTLEAATHIPKGSNSTSHPFNNPLLFISV
jgi:hypothetical protein